jgi:hypothetical protein
VSFKGWYISLEPWNFVGDSTRAKILNEFLTSVTATCKEMDKKRGKNKPIALSIFFNKNLTSADDVVAIYGDEVLKKSGVDILLLQDSLAVNGWSEDYVPVMQKYFAAFKTVSERNNMKFWVLAENFEPEHHATSIERLTAQLTAEEAYTSTFVTFDYYHYMNPLVSNIPLAPLSERQKLYNDYKNKFVEPK